MKTNRSARKVRKLRNIMACLAIAALAVGAFTVGQSLAARYGQTSVCQTQGPQAPNIDLGVLLASMR